MSEKDGGGGGDKKDLERRPPRARAITLKFEKGSPLKLPEEDDAPDEERPLRLDTGEFHADETGPRPPGDPYQRAADLLADWSAGRSSAPPAAPKPTPSAPPLDLDLEGLDERPATRGTMEYSPGMIRPRVLAARPVGTPPPKPVPPPIPDDALEGLESLEPGPPLPASLPPSKGSAQSKAPAPSKAPASSWAPTTDPAPAP